LRARIRDAGEDVSDDRLRELWHEAQAELDRLSLFGDLVLAAFFQGDKPKARDQKRRECASHVAAGDAERYRQSMDEWTSSDGSLAPFHWEIEFPEVFERNPSGFDAIVGNPPFLGGKRISTILGDTYKDYLIASQPEANGNTDLCARFFRRAF